jgi:ribonucleoside-triphosphate reductase
MNLKKLRTKLMLSGQTAWNWTVAAAITCVKPSGTVSQLVNSASGIHPRWAAYYLRTVRNDAKDPLSAFLKDQGIPCEPDQRNANALVFSFPQQAPKGSIVRSDVDALNFLEVWKDFQENWCEHKPSCYDLCCRRR